MTVRNDSMESTLATPIAARVGSVILVTTAVIFLAHMSYFAINMPPLDIEVMRFGRGVACICAALSLCLLSKIATVWTGDAVVGASACVALLLFPSTAFVFALSVPIALLVLLFLLGVWLATVVDGEGRIFVPLAIGGLAAALPLLATSGIYLSTALLLLVAVEPSSKWFLMRVGGATVLAVIALRLFFPAIEYFGFHPWGLLSMSALSSRLVLLDSILRPYGMLWLGLIFSLCGVLGSRLLRHRIPSVLARRLGVITIMFCFAVISIAASSDEAGTDLSIALAFNAILPLGVMLTLPMLLWIRFVMPQIRSVWIWILLPVVMYSCFWVVLGPIDLDAFPYDQVGSSKNP